MSGAVEELQPQTGLVPNVHEPAADNGFVTAAKWRLQTILAVPVAAAIALGIHFLAGRHEISSGHYYSILLFIALGAGLVGTAFYPLFERLRRPMQNLCPIFGATILLVSLWEVITSGFRLLPLPYFPGPAAVLE